MPLRFRLQEQDAQLVAGGGYSGGSGNSCVEIADLTATRGAVGVRDSKDKRGPALLVTATTWTAFVELARSERTRSGTV
ncbi:DUF397 domain-containing protein [Streptomyces corynorhini]|uniref:DUF397 domain-containing protein n=1 Tax=Streptomyces corynorhini TaxID=2282652 RepID=A0A370AZP1_9ACTN|nr:DUF397 domain-containing protein [Streptomyces corynorhini]